MTKGVFGIHGLGSQTNVGRDVTPFSKSDVSSKKVLRDHGHRCVSQQTANLLHALLHTYIGVGYADLSGRCLFGVVRIHTGISREIE
jgi:hypothetical protein